MKTRIASKQNARSLPLPALVAFAGFLLLTAAFPFVMKNGYANITGVRFLFFTVISSITFVSCAVTRLYTSAPSKSSVIDTLIGVNALDVAFWLFFLAVTVSTLASDYVRASLLGNEGRYMGLLLYIAVACLFIWLTRWFVLSDAAVALFTGVSCIAVLFAFLQFEGVDLFRLLSAVPFESRRNFVSSFGNINVYAAYLAAVVPVSMYLSCFAESRRARILFLAFAGVGFLGLFTSNTDSAYIAFGAAFFVLFVLCCASHTALVRWVRLALVFCGADFAFTAVYGFVGGTRGVSRLTSLFTHSPLPFALAAVLLCLYALLMRRPLTDRALRRIKKGAVIAAACVAAAALGLIVYFTFINKTAQLGDFEKYLRFNDRWGTDRGYVWSRSLSVFAGATLREKLFGFGPDTLAPVLVQSYGSEMLNKMGYLFDNAHNEFLQYLLTTGVCGLITYVALLIAAVKAGFTAGSVCKRAFALALVAYAAQSFFNLLQPISSVYVFILIGLIGARQTANNGIIDTDHHTST